MIINDATESDFTAIQAIYAHYVEHTTVSLEEIPPTVDEMQERWRQSQEKSLPYLVAKVEGRVAGYAYAVPYRPRSAYRFAVEESVYVSKDYQGLGVGRLLLKELIRRCTTLGYQRMLAVIAGKDNTPSIRFHQHFGFRPAGCLEKFGFKHGQWVDTILMQRDLES